MTDFTISDLLAKIGLQAVEIDAYRRALDEAGREAEQLRQENNRLLTEVERLHERDEEAANGRT